MIAVAAFAAVASSTAFAEVAFHGRADRDTPVVIKRSAGGYLPAHTLGVFTTVPVEMTPVRLVQLVDASDRLFTTDAGLAKIAKLLRQRLMKTY